jgi:hypothetical protein
MVAVRRLAKAIVNEPDKAKKDLLGTRFFYLHEGLALVPKENKGELLKLLPPAFHRSDPDALITVDQAAKSLETLDTIELKRHATEMLDSYPKLAIRYGGAIRELGYQYSNPQLRDSLGRLAEAVDSQLAWGHRPDLIRALAKFEVAMWESTRMTPADFLEQSLSVQVDRKSNLYRWFVLSGVSGGGPRDLFATPMYDSVSYGSKP